MADLSQAYPRKFIPLSLDEETHNAYTQMVASREYNPNTVSAIQLSKRYKVASEELHQKDKDMSTLVEKIKCMDMQKGQILAEHRKFLTFIHPFTHDNVTTLMELMDEYTKTQETVLNEWIAHTTEKRKKLEQELRDLHEEVNAIREILVAGVRGINKDATHLTCPFCFENDINTCCTPCGHTLCEKCKIKLSRSGNYCPMCRTTVKAFIKIFIS